MKFYRLKIQEMLIVTLLFGLDFLFAVSQKYYIPEFIRPYTLLAVTVLLFFIFFVYAKPGKPLSLSSTLSFIIGIAVIILIVVLHVIITFNLSHKQAVVFFIAAGSPFISGWLYFLLKRLKKSYP